MTTATTTKKTGAVRGASFVISLDFELHWGVCDRDDSLTSYRQNLLNARQVIPRLLELFREFDIQATWAVVGLLFFESKDELRAHLPSVLPRYANAKLSAYEYLDLVGNNEEDDPLHFAPSLIDQIASTRGQRIASHTFSHFYCLEKGQTKAAFEADLQMAVKVAQMRGYEVDSLVFPRNQLNLDYLPLLQRYGFRAYRGNPSNWMYQPRAGEEENLAHRGLRLLDAYVPLPPTSAPEEPTSQTTSQSVVDIPASRFLRPYFPTLRGLEEIRFQRIKGEIMAAATSQKPYHLWWHPHNFGADTEENFAFLRRILEYHRRVDERYGMPSLTMGDAARGQVMAV